MSKQIINIGTSANDRTGDPLRTAFDKVNQNFTELYDRDTATAYHLGDDVQFVDIDPNSGLVQIQSGFDTSMPIYIKGANCSDGGVGGSVVIEAGGAPLPSTGTTGNIEMAAHQTTIDSENNIWTFGSDGVTTFPELEGENLFIQGPEIGSTTSGIAVTAFNEILLRTDALGNTKLWVLDKQGTITTPVGIPTDVIRLTFDPIKMISDPVEFTEPGDLWYVDIQFQIAHDSTVTTVVDGLPHYLNPGYIDGYAFRFTEEDHGIPGFDLDVTLSNIQNPGDGLWTSNYSFTQPPVYPSTITTAGAVKLSADGNDWVFGTDGVLNLPAGGDIQIGGQTVLGGSGANTGDIGFVDNAMYNLDGVIVENADLSHNATAALVIPANGSTTFPIELNNTYGNINIQTGPTGVVTSTWAFGDNGTLTLPGTGTVSNTAAEGPASGTIHTFTSDEDGVESTLTNATRIYLAPDVNSQEIAAGWIITFANNTTRTVTEAGAGMIPHTGLAISWSDLDPLTIASSADIWPLTVQSADYSAGGSVYSLDISPDGTTTWTLNSDGSMYIPTGGSIWTGSTLSLWADNQELTLDSNNGDLTTPGDVYPGNAVRWSSGSGVVINNVPDAPYEHLVISVNNTSGTKRDWSFKYDGRFVTPGEVWTKAGDGINGLVFSSNGTDISTYIKVDGGSNTVIDSTNNFYAKRAGSDRFAITDTTTDVMASTSVRVQSNKVGTANTWTFNSSGTLDFPNGGSLRVSAPPTSSTGSVGDKSGTIAVDSSAMYYCIADYNASNPTADIWVKSAWVSTGTWG